ncbi:hypothetical protein V6N13_106695 [Hibiscus sabdariffa]
MMEALRVTKEQGNSPIYKIRKDVLNERSPQIEAREVLLDNSPRVGAPNLDSVEVQYGNPQFSGLRKCLLSLPSLPKAQLRNSLRKLQVVAEGVAASVFQSSTPSNPDIPATTNESGFEGNQETNVSTRNIEMQHKAKFEEIKTKQPDITNFGFRVSDGIGCLQWRGTDVAIKRINDRCFAGKPSEQECMAWLSIFSLYIPIRRRW